MCHNSLDTSNNTAPLKIRPHNMSFPTKSLFKHSQQTHQRQTVQRPMRTALFICLSALSIGEQTIVGQRSALAEPSLQQTEISTDNTQTTSRLSELINSVPKRPIAPLSQEQPGSEQPDLIDSTTTETQGEEAPLKLLLRLSDRRVYVYQGDEEIKSYPVAVGRSGWETPTGEFSIKAMVEDPGWTNPITNEVMGPGPNNPLGDRWMAFWTDGNNVIGFHGTPDRDSIGKAASHGCVRMYNEHARELFEIVKIGTLVIVE